MRRNCGGQKPLIVFSSLNFSTIDYREGRPFHSPSTTPVLLWGQEQPRNHRIEVEVELDVELAEQVAHIVREIPTLA